MTGCLWESYVTHFTLIFKDVLPIPYFCFSNTLLHVLCAYFALVAIQGSKWRREAIQVQRDPILSSSSKLLNSKQCQDSLLVNVALLLFVASVAKHCNGKNSHPLSSKSVSGPLTFEWSWIISSAAQGGIICGAIDEPRKSSKAIDERVIINFRYR